MTALDDLAGWIGETLAHHMLAESTDVVVVLSADDRVVLLSAAASRLRWVRDEVVGTAWNELLHPDDHVPSPPVRRRAHGASGSGTHTVPHGSISVRRGDGGWERVDVTRYTAELEPYGPVALLVLRAA